MQTLIVCIGCSQNRPHHSKGYCRNCYHKFIVRGTGDFDRNNSESYQKHLSAIKEKISVTQKQRVKNAIISKLSAEQLKKLYCDEKLSMGDIAKSYNCSRAYIMLLLKKYNLPIRSKSVARAEAKKQGKNVGFNSINENFFKNQTLEMAYVLGFIYSDGNLGNQLDHFSISQKEPEILYKIKELMSSDHQIVRKTDQEIYILTIGNKVMINDLISLGVTPNKSLDAKFPALSENLYAHFIRGYFDGDGSIFYSGNSWRVGFTCGSRAFIYGLEEVFNKFVGVSKRTVSNHPTARAYQLVYFRRLDLVKIFDFIYDAVAIQKEVFLDRKYNLFKSAVFKTKGSN
jgi:predicted DNA-binding protein YlxM (UPF0122 family)